ncbi:LCP family protein [Deinococcus wulumuqiensis R12]|nr:LCP family protein [Deinococcus wulumuqiensis R12]
MLARVRRVLALILIVLAGLVALLSPAFPALARYGALPRHGEKPLNVLLAGVDVDYDDKAGVWPYPAKPEDYSGRTDTIVMTQVRPDGTVKLLSIPRDSWVPIVGWSGGSGKINSANVHGGPDMLVNTVQALTGVRPDGYALLSLNALRAVTEAVGGVTIDVPQRMKYDDNAGNLHIDLQPGRQRLSGEQAEGFLRFRKDNLGDIGRVGRQQQFLTALIAEIRRPANVWKLPRVIAALDANAKTNLTRAQIAELLGAAQRGPKVSTYTVPGNFGMVGAASVWNVDTPRLDALLGEQFRDPNDPHGLRVLVFNADAPDGSARRLKARLESLGYRNVTAANEARPWPVTTVSGPAAPAAALLRDLGYGQLDPAAPGTPGSELTIRLGRDTPAQ